MSSYPEYYFMRYILRVFIGICLIVFSQQTFASEKSSLELVRPAQQRLEALREKVSEALLRPIKPSRLSQNNTEAIFTDLKMFSVNFVASATLVDDTGITLSIIFL